MKQYWNKLKPRTRRILWVLFLLLVVSCSHGPKTSCAYSHHDVSYSNRLDAKIYHICKTGKTNCQIVKNRYGEIIQNNCN